MSRPVDCYEGVACLKYAPKNVMFMGWVGDQANSKIGFQHAMKSIIHSASENYLNFGFDIGGYKDPAPSQKYIFLRWAQVGAFLPFM